VITQLGVEAQRVAEQVRVDVERERVQVMAEQLRQRSA